MRRFLFEITRKIMYYGYRFKRTFLQETIFHYYQHKKVIRYHLALDLEIIIIIRTQDANNIVIL